MERAGSIEGSPASVSTAAEYSLAARASEGPGSRHSGVRADERMSGSSAWSRRCVTSSALSQSDCSDDGDTADLSAGVGGHHGQW